MKNRMKAVLLAAGLTAGMLSMNVYAEQTTEATVAEVESEIAAVETEVASELAETDETAAPTSEEDYYKQAVASSIEQIAAMTDAQLEQMVEAGGYQAALATNWMNVKEELGAFVSVEDQTYTMAEDGKSIEVDSTVKYDNVDDKTKVTVATTMSQDSMSMSWDVKYPLGKLMEQAGLNTVMGIGIVFCTLVFLSFVISRFKYLSGFGDKKKKEQAAAKAAAPAPVVEEVEEDVTDDEEIVAVIAAAIAAYEGTTPDGFVVRSIKKHNKRSWRNA